MKKKYNILTSVFLFVNLVLWALFKIPLEFNLSFLIPFIFSLFLTHPDIEEYKKNYKHSYSASRVLFRLENFIKEKTTNDYLVLYLPSFVFFVLFMLSQLNLLLLPAYFGGIIYFELFRKLLNKPL